MPRFYGVPRQRDNMATEIVEADLASLQPRQPPDVPRVVTGDLCVDERHRHHQRSFLPLVAILLGCVAVGCAAYVLFHY